MPANKVGFRRWASRGLTGRVSGAKPDRRPGRGGRGGERERERARVPSAISPSPVRTRALPRPTSSSLDLRSCSRRVCVLSPRSEVLCGIVRERERREESGEGEGGPCLDVAYRATKGGARTSPSLALHIALLARTSGLSSRARPRGPSSLAPRSKGELVPRPAGGTGPSSELGEGLASLPRGQRRL